MLGFINYLLSVRNVTGYYISVRGPLNILLNPLIIYKTWVIFVLFVLFSFYFFYFFIQNIVKFWIYLQICVLSSLNVPPWQLLFKPKNFLKLFLLSSRESIMWGIIRQNNYTVRKTISYSYELHMNYSHNWLKKTPESLMSMLSDNYYNIPKIIIRSFWCSINE